MKTTITAILLLLASHLAISAAMAPKDSVGVERVNNKLFVLHKVEPKETLFSISRKYNVAYADIVTHNPDVQAGLKSGQILKIPRLAEIPVSEEKGKVVHVVKSSETIFSISRLYNVSEGDLAKWNDLKGYNINVGQELIIYPKNTSAPSDNVRPTASGNGKNAIKDSDGRLVHTIEAGQTLFAISRMYNADENDILKWNGLTSPNISVGQKLIVARPERKENKEAKEPKDDTKNHQTVVKKEPEKKEPQIKTQRQEVVTVPVENNENSNTSGFRKVVEMGMAEVIDNSAETKKFLALHRTAPVGTIMQIRNEMNNMNVFVRVVGKLPETGINEKVLVKISRTAFDKLGAIDNRFPVEISYVP